MGNQVHPESYRPLRNLWLFYV